ncbi:RNA polymerase sigma-70 factor [uncultured Draconibacterium sp.]|uniref:RNA polymerase sigma factor n=1 Tax=uncultured Draconibacterium sp. TaxID=1573823 RepID=UPI0032178950
MFNNETYKTEIAQGNQKFFRKMMDITADELLHFAMGFLRNKEIAEEIVSDVFVKIWSNRSDIESILNLKSYLFICVKNGCLSHLRKAKNDKLVLLGEYKDFQFLPVESPEDDLLEEDAIKRIHEAIQELPPKCREAFSLAKISGFKHREIAEIMNISEKTVNNHLVTAVKKISDILGIDKKSGKSYSPLKQASLFSFLW